MATNDGISFSARASDGSSEGNVAVAEVYE